MLLAREFGWTIDEIKQLTYSELQAIVEELKKQKLIEKYEEQITGWSYLASVIINIAKGLAGDKNPVEPVDLLSKEFRKQVETILKAQSQQNDWAKLIEDAKAKGLKGPW